MNLEERTEAEQTIIESIMVKPDKFIIYNVYYEGTTDNYLFNGFQETDFGDVALYHGLFHEHTICLSTIKQLQEIDPAINGVYKDNNMGE